MRLALPIVTGCCRSYQSHIQGAVRSLLGDGSGVQDWAWAGPEGTRMAQVPVPPSILHWASLPKPMPVAPWGGPRALLQETGSLVPGLQGGPVCSVALQSEQGSCSKAVGEMQLQPTSQWPSGSPNPKGNTRAPQPRSRTPQHTVFTLPWKPRAAARRLHPSLAMSSSRQHKAQGNAPG